MARKVPRPFNYEWGKGQIVEEVSATNEYSEPTIQLLQFDDEGHGGHEIVRFCSYTPTGAFRRHPMLAGKEEFQQFRAALKTTPRLRALLKELTK